MEETRTIAAISTGLKEAGISVIRVSGPEAIPVSDRIFYGRKRLSDTKSHTIRHGVIRDGERVIDEVLVSVMRAPNTYTGEDVREINCHGGVLVTKTILKLLTEHGASLAEPGEFTKRAFLNGRMDLSRAEAVMDLVSAKNEFALKAGINALRGGMEETVRALRNTLLDEIAFIEAALDDPEHYELDGYAGTLLPKVSSVRRSIGELIERSKEGSLLKEGIRTAILGRPNAGKSSLLNLLSGYEKSIVTEIPGTTRDVLTEEISIGPVTLLLQDTAGIRKTLDPVEKIGVDRAKKAAFDADLVIYLTDASEGLTAEDKAILEEVKAPKIVLYNKADLMAEKALKTAEKEDSGAAPIFFSCITKEGLETLKNRIASMFDRGELRLNDEIVIANLRQEKLLQESCRALCSVEDGIRDGVSEEFLSADLMEAYSRLGEIIGEEVTDDVVDRVFEKFCMGK